MIGQRIKELRLESSLTQRELAEKLGLTPKMISFYENEERFPPQDILLKLSDIFDVSVDFILGKQNRLSDKEMKEIQKEADKVREYVNASLIASFDGKPADDETFEKVMKALEYGMELARQEAKEKYTPKKYKK